MAAVSMITMGVCLTSIWGGLIYYLTKLIRNEAKNEAKAAVKAA